MLKSLSVRYACVVFAVILLAGCSDDASQKTETFKDAPLVLVTTGKPGLVQSGEALFKQYCSSCHPNGGNVSDPRRSLYLSSLKRNHITTPEDIVRIMRNPLSRMIRFDVSTVSDKDARTIAEYILATFK